MQSVLRFAPIADDSVALDVGDELGIAQPVKDVDIEEIGDARLVEQGLQPNDMPVFEPWAAQRKVMSEALR